MVRQAPFTEFEAVLLLNAYLRTVSGDILRKDAVKDCSEALRRMAINKGIEINDTYRNTGGISFLMTSMESRLSWKDDNKTSNETVCRNGFHVQE